MMDKLLPCPFCGGEAHASEETKELGGTIMDGHIVWCGFCNCNTDLYTEQYLAIEAWNRRST